MKKLLILIIASVVFISGCSCLGKAIEGQLADEMRSDDVQTRIEAARKLGEVATPEALRLLMLHKNDPDFRVKDAVNKSLRKIDSRTFLN